MSDETEEPPRRSVLPPLRHSPVGRGPVAPPGARRRNSLSASARPPAVRQVRRDVPHTAASTPTVRLAAFDQREVDAAVAEVQRALATITHGAAVILAVSGGPDSVAMTNVVAIARSDLRRFVVHVRHGWRDDSDDAAAALAAADATGASYDEVRVTLADQIGDGPEDGARQARYRVLAEAERRYDAEAVLVAHTMDDQAETVLLRIARGTGPAGLAAMRRDSSDAPHIVGGQQRPRRILRPLLGVRRETVLHCTGGLRTVDDPTNHDLAMRRNRARHSTLNSLGALRPDNGDVVPALARLAELAANDQTLIERYVAQFPVHRIGDVAVWIPCVDGIPRRDPLHAALLRRGWQHLSLPPSQAQLDQALRQRGGEHDGPNQVRVNGTENGWVLRRAAKIAPLLVRQARSTTLSVLGDAVTVTATTVPPPPRTGQVTIETSAMPVRVVWGVGPNVPSRILRGALPSLHPGLWPVTPVFVDAEGEPMVIGGVPVQQGKAAAWLQINAASMTPKVRSAFAMGLLDESI